MCAYCCQNVERQVASVRGNNAAASLRSLGVEGTRRDAWMKKKKERRLSCVPTPHARAYMMSPYNTDTHRQHLAGGVSSLTKAYPAAVRSSSS